MGSQSVEGSGETAGARNTNSSGMLPPPYYFVDPSQVDGGPRTYVLTDKLRFTYEGKRAPLSLSDAATALSLSHDFAEQNRDGKHDSAENRVGASTQVVSDFGRRSHRNEGHQFTWRVAVVLPATR